MTELTVCVPAYRAGRLIRDTLDSIASQTLQDVRVVVSIDPSDDDTEPVCRGFLRDRRFEVVVQRARLGWVGNVNALIDRVDTPFFCIVPHDDILAPRYLEATLALARSDPRIACAYSDIEGFGAAAPSVVQPEIRGGRLDRALDFFVNHFGAVGFRGVIRRTGPDDRPYLPTGLRRDFAADTVWLLRLALRGELRRVPEALYWKRYAAGTVHAGWHRWSRVELLDLWAEQAAACARMAIAELDAPAERDAVLVAALFRVLGIGKVAPGFATATGPLEIAEATALLAAALGAERIPPDLRAVLETPEARVLRVAIRDRIWHQRRPTLAERVRWWVSETACIDDLQQVMA